MKKLLFLLTAIFILLSTVFFLPKSNAQDTSCDIQNVQNACSGTNGLGSACNDLLNQCKSTISQALNDLAKAIAPNQARLDNINSQILGIKATVANIEVSLASKKKSIDQGYSDLAKQQAILNATIRDYYIKSYYNSPLVIFLSSSTASEFTQLLGYQRATADRDKAIITNIALSIEDLEIKKKDLENQEANLTGLKTNLDEQSVELNKLVSGAKAYQTTLSNQLSSLNSIQQSILSARLSGLNIPLYASSGGSCSSDIGKDPGFSPKFGFYTFGVPNRVGLNQYGAYGRANAGQSSDTILRAYYNFDSYDSSSYTGAQIKVNDGNGINTGNIIWTGSLEDYVKRIYEVPDSWPMEALKAQAIAVRSYVLAATGNGANSICATQNCQVFKSDPKGGNWDQAVNNTAGQVMVQGGNPIKAWFSSTHGGYVFNSGDIGWSGTSFTKNAVDTTSGSAGSFSDVQNNAYDKDSPWFYCDWGSRSSYNGTAWLKPEEIADIVNVLILAQKDNGTVDHLYQPDKPNPAGTDTWDASRVRQELNSRGVTPFNTISDISISADFGAGRTTSVSVTGDAGSQSFPADSFVTYFDLRAPATIYIPQLGKNGDGTLKAPLFNVER